MRTDTLCIELVEPQQANGYLELLEAQTNDAGFQEDAKWLRAELERIGWLTDDQA